MPVTYKNRDVSLEAGKGSLYCSLKKWRGAKRPTARLRRIEKAEMVRLGYGQVYETRGNYGVGRARVRRRHIGCTDNGMPRVSAVL